MNSKRTVSEAILASLFPKQTEERRKFRVALARSKREAARLRRVVEHDPYAVGRILTSARVAK